MLKKNKYFSRILITIASLLFLIMCVSQYNVISDLETNIENKTKKQYIYVTARELWMDCYSTSFYEIIGNPEKFHKKNIFVQGVLYVDAEKRDANLFATQEAYLNLAFRDSISIRREYVEQNIDSLYKLNGCTVRVYGIYSSDYIDNINGTGRIKYVFNIR